MTPSFRTIAAATLFGLVLTAALPARAGVSFENSSTGRQIALGVGSGLASLVYTPVKALYAGGTIITGGLVLAFTGGSYSETAGRIVERGTGGDWWVHPDVITGHRSLHFIGN